MPVSPVSGSAHAQTVSFTREKTGADGFSRALSDAVTSTDVKSLKPDSVENRGSQNSARPAYTEIGRISKATPTVSHILKNHPEFSDRCWDIIFASENRGKQFTEMREGTVVALKTGSSELLWGKELAAAAHNAHPESSAEVNNTAARDGIPDKSIPVGTISRDNPTVSHLFQAHPDFDNRFWEIIHSPVNSGKNYTSLRPGTRVMLDPETMTLSFAPAPKADTQMQTAKSADPEQITRSNEGHISLADAVRPFIGEPYKKIDCFGLIVRGLINQGVQYRGHGGLWEKLKNLAMRDGLPSNAYLTGEGLVEKAGTKIFSESMQRISNTRAHTDEIYSKMSPYLREGLILSFSTPTRGHTGIVAKKGGEWTYINSGKIDNQVTPGKVSERVGEEYLREEIKNWFALAANRKEPITVTLGQVDVSRM